MCGRVTQEGIRGIVSLRVKTRVPDGWGPSWNIAPTNPLLVITPAWEVAVRRWGLVPAWSKDLAFGSKCFNARAETVAEKPSFRAAFKKSRVLVPVNGFYEWLTQGKTKTPFFISNAAPEEMLVFAGLEDRWEGGPEGEVCSASIVTTTANDFIRPIHPNRMPVLLAPGQWDSWLDPKASPADLQGMLRPAPEDALRAWQVRPVRGDGPELIEPVA